MINQQQQKRRVKARIVPDGWAIEIDDQSWAEMMTALSIAIDACERSGTPAEQDRAATLRTLRSALSRAER